MLSVFPASMSVPLVNNRCPERPKDCIGSPGAGVAEGCEPPNEPSPLEEQPLTHHPQSASFKCKSESLQFDKERNYILRMKDPPLRL